MTESVSTPSTPAPSTPAISRRRCCERSHPCSLTVGTVFLMTQRDSSPGWSPTRRPGSPARSSTPREGSAAIDLVVSRFSVRQHRSPQASCLPLRVRAGDFPGQSDNRRNQTISTGLFLCPYRTLRGAVGVAFVLGSWLGAERHRRIVPPVPVRLGG